MLGYKHTIAGGAEAKQKMVERFKDITNHPMYGKKHSEEILKLISKPGELNPMQGKKHSDETKKAISLKMSKYPDGVGIFDLTACGASEIIYARAHKKFNNNTEIANYLGISKVTVGKYLNKDLIYKDMYKFKPIS